MTYDLRHEPWIPWRRRSGEVEWGPPATLVDRIDDDPVVALATPRPDFDGAMQELLIGLLGAALLPRDDDEWAARWHRPPSREELQAALDAMPDAFDLDGDGPRFFQDLSTSDLESGEQWSIESLLISSPGSTEKEATKRDIVTDLFVKSGEVGRLGPPAAAMALVTLQTYSPEGGRGHRTSLRGGGPLTTLIDPRSASRTRRQPRDGALWAKLWANVQAVAQWSPAIAREKETRPDDVFPWLASTRTSEAGRPAITSVDAHPLQAYFGLPRRIRLDAAGPGRCDLTGFDYALTFPSFRMRTYGVQYQAWRHPLSPYYADKDEWRAVHGRAEGFTWRDWPGLALQAPQGATREPAAVVSWFGKRATITGSEQPRLHMFGYDLKHKKAIGWTEATVPVFVLPNETALIRLHDTVARLREGTELAAFALTSAVKNAFFRNGKDAPGDYSAVKQALWSATEAPFYAAVGALAASTADANTADANTADAECQRFAAVLEGEAGRAFDRWCPAEGLTPEALRRHVVARYDLVSALRGRSKLGEKLFAALRIPVPDGAKKARAAKTRSRTEATT